MLNITLLITFIFSFVTVYASDLAINGQYIQMETMKLRSSIKKTVNFKPHPDTMHELTFAVKQNNADKMHDNHISAQATAVTGYVQISEFASSTCDGTALRAIDYAIGPCIPISVADGTNSFQYMPSTDSTVLVNYFTDTACTTSLVTDVLVTVGVCNEQLNSHGSLLTVFLSTTTSPIPSFLATSLTVIRGYIDKYSYILY